MALTDITGLLANASQILGIVQIVAYVFLSLFFGAIVMMGYRGYVPWWASYPLRLGLGFVCLVCGIGVSAFIPVPSPLDMFQLDVMIGGIISSIVLLVAINVLSYRMPWLLGGFENRVQHYEEKVSDLKKGGPLKWVTPMRIVGIVIFLGFLIFALVNFQGFPSFESDILSSLTGADTGSMSAECNAMMSELYSNINMLMGGSLPSPYTNPSLKAAFEQGCGESISGLYKFDFDTPVVLGSTGNANIMCLGTETEFCTKIDISTLGFG